MSPGALFCGGPAGSAFPAGDSELCLRPGVELLALIRGGKLSVLELAEAHIARIEWLNPVVQALVDFDPDRVRAQARALDASGWSEDRPLFGLPVTVKSSISVAGHLCETGSLLHRGRRPDEDAVAVARLRRAGAVILGTTNCPEFLTAYETENRLHGQTRNPWALERTPGGSSGGESAAIAAGLSAGGLGSDSGGSVRVPAHFTGICSLKPTPGRIPAAGHLPPCAGPFATLGAIGLMARRMADVEVIFRALAGADASDPAGAPVPLRLVADRELAETAVGWFEDDGLTPVTDETRAAVRAAAGVLRERGLRVEPISRASHPGLFASLERARLLWWKFFVQGGAMLLEPPVRDQVGGREELVSATFLGFLEIAHQEPPLTGEELLGAWIEADLVRAELLGYMRELPILLCPVCAVPAFRHGERRFAAGAGQVGYLDAMRYSQWFNLLGAPAAVAPVGWSPEGLPIGVQVAGRPYTDELVLAVAGVVDAAFAAQPGTRI